MARHPAPLDRRVDRRAAAGTRRPAHAGHLRSHPEAHRRTPHHRPLHGHAAAGEPRRAIIEEFLRFWSARPEVEKIWMSLYTPQIGEVSDERLRPADRERVVADLLALRLKLSEAGAAEGPPRRLRRTRRSPRRMRLRADDRDHLRRSDDADHAVPVRRRARLQQLRLHRVGRPRRGRAASALRLHPGRTDLRRVAESRRSASGGCVRPSRPRPDAILSDRATSAPSAVKRAPCGSSCAGWSTRRTRCSSRSSRSAAATSTAATATSTTRSRRRCRPT